MNSINTNLVTLLKKYLLSFFGQKTKLLSQPTIVCYYITKREKHSQSIFTTTLRLLYIHLNKCTFGIRS